MTSRDDVPHARYAGEDPYDMPVDLAAVQADDALLDLIGRTGRAPSGADDDLARVLAAWRREVHAEPFSELVDTDTALAVIHAAHRPARQRHRVFSPVAAAAAVLVIAFSSVGLVAKSAHPGDPLWGVTRVLYGDYAHSVQTAADVQSELSAAKVDLAQGKPEQARAKLQQVQSQLPAVGESEGHADLASVHHKLEQMLNESPNVPPVTVPSAPVPPPSEPSSTRRAPGLSPNSGEPATSGDGSTAPSSPTQPSSGTAGSGASGSQPNPIQIGPGHAYPGPRGSSSGIGPRGPIGPEGPIGPSGNSTSSGSSTHGIPGSSAPGYPSSSGGSGGISGAPGTTGSPGAPNGGGSGAGGDDDEGPKSGPSSGPAPHRNQPGIVSPSMAAPTVPAPNVPAPSGAGS
ncbi:MAG: anti-sigma-D factor RsdA [Pseudonocardiaceae bacterium]